MQERHRIVTIRYDTTDLLWSPSRDTERLGEIGGVYKIRRQLADTIHDRIYSDTTCLNLLPNPCLVWNFQGDSQQPCAVVLESVGESGPNVTIMFRSDGSARLIARHHTEPEDSVNSILEPWLKRGVYTGKVALPTLDTLFRFIEQANVFRYKDQYEQRFDAGSIQLLLITPARQKYILFGKAMPEQANQILKDVWRITNTVQWKKVSP
jgi:hypothetical protein